MNEAEIEKLARLSRIECSLEEKKKLVANLSKVINYVELLKEINTEGIEPCNHILEEHINVFRMDEIGSPLPREEFLANAPAHIGGMIKVPPVMKERE